ncbi:MAG TPA: sigma-54 dependent transcriptional regulator [Bryobacteraceae bacterium]|nr:sigma-54 dependent transcriptional regulator [Bryobacteraceae bacterium]
MKSHWQILVVDDEEVMCESLAAWLREDGYLVDTAASGRGAVEKARSRDYAIYFVDLKMPGGMDGIETMMQIRRLHPDASIIIITAYATVDTAITAMKEGAQEYIVKPCNPEEISLLVSRIIKVKNLQRENSILRKKLTRQYSVHDVVSKNPKMQDILRLAQEIASLRSTVLIQGESGTGKEMVARAIHFSGDRAQGPFIAVSCAALAETLLESELFGHEKGAFTGATGQKRGKFEMADGGTLFLDEIGDISAKLQVDLLRVLQDRSFYRVGGSQEVRVDVRVIAASHVNLQQAVAAGKFRDDLFYRLNVIEVRIPPLRDRREDIPLLVRHFIEKLSPELGKEIQGISEGALRVLMDYNWPGNVRELENAVERAMVSCRSKNLADTDFSFLVPDGDSPRRVSFPAGMSLAEMEKVLIAATLERTGGNIKESASVLGIDRSTIYEKIRKYEIPRP